MDTVYITHPWMLLFVAAVVALHVVTYFVPKLRLPLTFVNVIVHTAAAAAILAVGGEIEDFVLLLLISAFVSLFVGEREESKNAAAASAEAGKKEEVTK